MDAFRLDIVYHHSLCIHVLHVKGWQLVYTDQLSAVY